MSKSSVRARGFTLIEVMVALVVFAVAASMLMLADGNSIRQTRYMQEKVLAAQVADQYLSRMQAEKNWPDKGIKGKVENYAGYYWYVRQTVRDTSERDFRKIVVDVFVGNQKPGDDDISMFSLDSYLRKPKK
ncbi:type II secretion system minor pseudopilin GspI [Endozoicomonas arenosclerae]|uniref:type II secretion system minor pseudopilin GspI n=1 Tax=Endozoicomonas arenosclerae TaxID=1633495 RepID=UPI0007844C30|nr:type II secretion system minor pseudopilin GspI [Endozoicomonas arenosclerae]